MCRWCKTFCQQDFHACLFGCARSPPRLFTLTVISACCLVSYHPAQQMGTCQIADRLIICPGPALGYQAATMVVRLQQKAHGHSALSLQLLPCRQSKMEMTTPVISNAGQTADPRMQFVMEERLGRQPEDLPNPNDAR